MPRSQHVSFAASEELITALDADAFGHEETRAARIRNILAAHLRSVDFLGPYDPLTVQLRGKYTPDQLREHAA